MDILDGIPDTTKETLHVRRHHRRCSEVGGGRSTLVEGMKQWDDGSDEEHVEEAKDVAPSDGTDDEENKDPQPPRPHDHHHHHRPHSTTPLQDQHHTATREALMMTVRGVGGEEEGVHLKHYPTNPLLGSDACNANPTSTTATTVNGNSTSTPQSRFLKVKLLARGTFGDAWLCVPRGCIATSASDFVVAKILHLPNMRTRELRYAQSEIHCLSNTNHVNIVKFVDSEVGKREIIIMMEYADAGDLRDHIKSRRGRRHHFTESEVMLLFIQLLMAVDHIHGRRMLHRDLKTANILLTTSGLIKVADFGFSHQYDETVSSAIGKTFCGTPHYVAPEMLAGMRYSSSSEVWSLGVILYEMFCLDRPFHSSTIKGLVEQVRMNETRPIPKVYSDDARALVATLLSHDPTQRPSCLEILTIPFVHQHFTSLIQLVAGNPHISQENKTQWLVDADGVRARIGGMTPSCMRPPPPFTSGTYPNPTDCLAAALSTSHQQSVKSEIRYEGAVNKLTISNDPQHDAWKKCYLYLRDGQLDLCEVAREISHCQTLSVDTLRSVAIIPINISHRKCVFAVHTAHGKSTWLQAPSDAEQHNWVTTIQKAMGV